MSDNIVGSLAASKPPSKPATGQWLIGVGVVSAFLGLILRIVARSQAGKAESLRIFNSYRADQAIQTAETLGNVGLALLIVGGALAFLGGLAILMRR